MKSCATKSGSRWDRKGEIVEQFEVVHYKLEDEGKADPQTGVGVWLGKTLGSDEHLLGAADGVRKCRSAFRRPEGKRWDRTVLDRMKGVPWQPKMGRTAMRGKPAPATPGKRGVYITVDRQVGLLHRIRANAERRARGLSGCYPPRPRRSVAVLASWLWEVHIR